MPEEQYAKLATISEATRKSEVDNLLDMLIDQSEVINSLFSRLNNVSNRPLAEQSMPETPVSPYTHINDVTQKLINNTDRLRQLRNDLVI